MWNSKPCSASSFHGIRIGSNTNKMGGPPLACDQQNAGDSSEDGTRKHGQRSMKHRNTQSIFNAQ